VKRRSDNYVPSKLCNWKERERERETHTKVEL